MSEHSDLLKMLGVSLVQRPPLFRGGHEFGHVMYGACPHLLAKAMDPSLLPTMALASALQHPGPSVK